MLKYCRLVLSITTVLLSLIAKGAQEQNRKAGFHVDGPKILTPDNRQIHLRGFNVLFWVPVTDQDAKDIQALGANSVRYMFGYTPTGKFDPSKISFLKEQVRFFTKKKIWVIVVIHDFRKDGKGPYDSSELNREFLDMWDYVIDELKDDPYVAAWEPINEPHDTTPEKVTQWYADLLPHFRKLDPLRSIVVEGANYSWPENLEPGLKQKDSNVIYSFHTYGPYEYTSQKKELPKPYPGKWSQKNLATAIEPAKRFRKLFNVPVWCGEWGVPTYCPGYTKWIGDVSSILEADHFPWTYWGWALKPANPTDDTFDVNPQKPEVYRLIQALFAKLVRKPGR